MRARLGAFCALICTSFAVARLRPDSAAVLALLAQEQRLFAFWGSIVLAATPYVVCGTAAAWIAARARMPPAWRIIAVCVLPGCDCALNSFASALAGSAPWAAGAGLTLGACCNPAAIAATHAAGGWHLVFARIEGGAAAAALTMVLWHAVARRTLSQGNGAASPCRCAPPASVSDLGRHLESTLGLVACLALLAAVSADFGVDRFRALRNPVAVALAGALISPCSVADALLARVAVHGSGLQAVFVTAAQLANLRRVVTLARVFGVGRAVAAAASGLFGCAVAWLAAH